MKAFSTLYHNNTLYYITIILQRKEQEKSRKPRPDMTLIDQELAKRCKTREFSPHHRSAPAHWLVFLHPEIDLCIDSRIQIVICDAQAKFQAVFGAVKNQDEYLA